MHDDNGFTPDRREDARGFGIALLLSLAFALAVWLTIYCAVACPLDELV